MSKPLSVNKPGLVKQAKTAQREIANLQALLTNTAGSHSTATTQAATAKSALDTLVATILAL
jgi:hypothetical protein